MQLALLIILWLAQTGAISAPHDGTPWPTNATVTSDSLVSPLHDGTPWPPANK
jgi:hypothetical protein